MRHLEAGVAHLAGLLLEDGADELLLGGELGLALGRDLADQQVAGVDLGADAHDAALVEVAERLFGAVGDVAGDLFVAKLGGAGVDLVLLDVDGGEEVVLHDLLAEDDGVFEVEALPAHEGDEEVAAQGDLAVIGGRPVGEHVAGLHLVAGEHERLLVDERALVGAHELGQVVGVDRAPAVVDLDTVGVHIADLAAALGDDHVARVDGGAELHAGAHVGRLGSEERHGLALHVRAHEGAVGVVVLEERDESRGDRDEHGRAHVHVVDLGGRHLDDVGAGARARKHHVFFELARIRVERRVGLGDGDVAHLAGLLVDELLLFLGGVEVDDLAGDLAAHDLAVRGADEAELVDGRHGGQRADEADVRAFGGLDGAHAAVVRRVHVANLDGGALAREAARAQRAQATAMRKTGQRVGLVHELRQLRGAEELLEGGHHGADVDQRRRDDRVGVFGGEALADDAFHAGQPDAERVLDELTDRAQPAVAEVLVFVDLVGDLLAARRQQRDGLGGEILGVLGHAELAGQRDESLDELDDVFVHEHAHVRVGALLGLDVVVQPHVELVAADAREVVALGVEEQAAEHRRGAVERRRLAGALLPEELDQRLFLRAGGVLLDGVLDVYGLVEQLDELVVAAVPHGAQQHGDRELALAVDAHVHGALLVDLELEPGAALRHEVGDQHLLLALGLLGLHDVGPGRAHQLRDDHALGAVDDEGAALGHHGEVAHEHRLLADLAGLLVDEGDLHRKRRREGHVLVAALGDGLGGLAELVLAELHEQLLGVILDGVDVGDGLAETVAEEPLPRFLLDVDEVGERQGLVELGERRTHARRLGLVQASLLFLAWTREKEHTIPEVEWYGRG